MLNFASLWVGKPLSKLEQVSISSFLYYGHTFTLYLYDMSLKVPLGVVKKDAREILPENKIFIVDNSYGPFADMFRYHMLQSTDYVWTDTDNICLTSNWPDKEYMFGLQGGHHELVAIGIIAAPRDSKLVKNLVLHSSNFEKKSIVWGEIGPQLFTKQIKKLGLSNHVLPAEAFYPIDYWKWKSIWEKKSKSQVLEACKKSYTLQVWNQMRSRNGVSSNQLPPGSAIEHFYKKYYKGDNEN
jgi:hypothetical protein